MSRYRQMRMIVTFDLPTTTNLEKKQYRDFRRALLDEGFIMMQYSTYIRFCRNDSEYAKYIRRIKHFSSELTGDVRIFGLTEKQYQNMYHISGDKNDDEKLLARLPLIIIE